MTTPSNGIGLASFGTSAYGYGTPAGAPPPGGSVNRDPATNRQLGSLALSLEFSTQGQYVFDEFGRRTGMRDVPHMVLLALRTVRGSAVQVDLGQRFAEIRKVLTSYPTDVKTRVEEALSDLVSLGFVRIDSIVPVPGNGSPARNAINLTDLTTGQPIPEIVL